MQIEWSTRDVPSYQRLAHWRSGLRAAWGGDFTVGGAADASFEASLGVLHTGPTRVVEIVSAPHTAARESPRDDSRVAFLLQIEGRSAVSDGSRTARLVPGEMCLMSPDRCSAVERTGQSRQLFIGVPSELVEAAAPRWREMAVITIESARPKLRDAVDLFRLLVDHHRELGAHCREKLATKGVGWLGEVLEAAHSASDPIHASRHARLAHYHRERIRRHVEARLRDPELNVRGIAEALGLSVRYVHKLFEGGPPVMQWVSAQRLQACERELATRGERSISDVAYAWGFNNPSHFSRAFKKHHGRRPSDT